MKRTLTLAGLLCALSSITYSQEIKGEYVNKQQVKIDQCDCDNLGNDEQVFVRVYLTENMFKYDKVIFFKTYTSADGKTVDLGGTSVLGERMRAEFQEKGFIDVAVASKTGGKWDGGENSLCTERNDFDLQILVRGEFITGYEEKVVGSTIQRNPTYGSATDFGTTGKLPFKTSAEAYKKKRKAILTRGGIVAGLTGAGVISLMIKQKNEE